MMDFNYNTKRTVETILPEIPSVYVHIDYMALNLISLWNSQDLLAVGILYQIKKAPANAEARPLLP
nr:MAG TPA: hypothetical protein [Caudoviricetes sp.]